MFLTVLGFNSIPIPTAFAHFRPRLAPLRALYLPSNATSSVVSDSLKLLEWDKVCDAVSSFAGTALGREVTKVKSAIDRACRGFSFDGAEAMAVNCLVQFAESLQITLKTALKEGAEWFNRFMPFSQLILNIVINRSFIKLVQQVIDEDGSVKDSTV